MKLSLIITVLGATIYLAMFSAGVRAESQSEQYLGEREMCLEVVRIKESVILDDQTILFEMLGGAFYLSRLPVECPGLKIAGGFGYETHLDKFCKQETIQVIGSGSSVGNTCMMGEFVRFKFEGMLSDARRLLKDGLLDTLVSEDAFDEAFPEE